MTVRPAAASAVLGLALAVGAPTAWVLSRPDAAAGPPVERVLESPAATTTTAPPTATLPEVSVRDAETGDVDPRGRVLLDADSESLRDSAVTVS
ncbi:hypothetical protein E9529_20605, partial [Blastococcus sp. KM273128]|nr:hypothetical protein [Blastococcus sp. KM273128]